jgi:hypothetical protein
MPTTEQVRIFEGERLGPTAAASGGVGCTTQTLTSCPRREEAGPDVALMVYVNRARTVSGAMAQGLERSSRRGRKNRSGYQKLGRPSPGCAAPVVTRSPLVDVGAVDSVQPSPAKMAFLSLAVLRLRSGERGTSGL